MMFDLLLKNGLLIDPVNEINRKAWIAIKHGKIAAVEGEHGAKTLPKADATIDLTGKYIMPGIIDTHAHVSSWIGGSAGYAMMAKAGVITFLDMAGPVEDIIASVGNFGSGLQVAVLNAILPLRDLASANPSNREIEKAVSSFLDRGALGVKILGGHYPLSPEATARIMEYSNSITAYLAFHAGTTETKSDLLGFKEALELIGDKAVHLAHINSYCRGSIKEPVQEVLEALALLENYPAIQSESYLSRINGTSGLCKQGVPTSEVTKNCLRMGGYAETKTGLQEAIQHGYCLVTDFRDSEHYLLTGDDALALWEASGTETTISFPVNDPRTLFLCATTKQKEGKFLVNAISTDGGGIPRNTLLSHGLSLVHLGALSLEEFVIKTSYNPSRMLGLVDKGHLGIGAEADITVFDFTDRKAYMGISGGTVIMVDGVIIQKAGTVLTTDRGKQSMIDAGVPHKIISLDHSLLYCG